MYVKCKKSTCLKWTYRLFDHNYWVAALSTWNLTVLGISIPSLKPIGQFIIPKLIYKKAQNSYAENGHTGNYYRVIAFCKR